MVKRLGRRGENILVARVKYLQCIYTSVVAGTKRCLFDRLFVSIKRCVYTCLWSFWRKADGCSLQKWRTYIYVRGTQGVNLLFQFQVFVNLSKLFLFSYSLLPFSLIFKLHTFFYKNIVRKNTQAQIGQKN